MAPAAPIRDRIRDFRRAPASLIDGAPWNWRTHGDEQRAVVRFVSYEPAIGSLNDLDITGIDWVIYGGESGPGWRPEDKEWAREMKRKCEATGAAFFHKQSAGYRTELGIELDGQIVRDYPTPRLAIQMA